nr:peptidase M15A [candidate division Zixibacteria bacterium]
MDGHGRCRPLTAFLIPFIVILLLLLPIHLAAQESNFPPGKAGFAIKFNGVVSPYTIMSRFLMPREELNVEVISRGTSGIFSYKAEGGLILSQAGRSLKWRAPETSGLYKIIISRSAPVDSIILNVFVMVSMARMEGEYQNGYRIGKYPKKWYKDLPSYKAPEGFIEVTREVENTRLTPHFTLKQFICKQSGDYPRYMVLREKLLIKLELILEKINEKGYYCRTLSILSGFRTPYYNRQIGNVKYSRHQWGGAADIFIDERPKDNMMDDLNRDGKINWKDAAIVYDIINELFAIPGYEYLRGGLARYKKTASHGPFVHVDVRGWPARWGF